MTDGRVRVRADDGDLLTYRTLQSQQKGSTVTELSLEGRVAPRRTPHSGYELPPEPPRVVAQYDGWGRYKLPSPTTGRPTGFTRATTIADTLDDKFNLSRYKRRETAKHLLAVWEDAEDGEGLTGDRMACVQAMVEAMDAEDKGAMDRALDRLDDLSGGRDAAELGTAVHAWLEAVDLSLVRPVDVPTTFQPYVTAYLDVLRRHGLVAEPQYVERIVLNDRGQETICGTLDRVYRIVATGELVLGDVKTSKTLEYGWLTYAVQLAIYGTATYMLDTAGKRWDSMPEIDPDYAIIVHVPSDQPERSSAVTMSLSHGEEMMHMAMTVRSRRSNAKKAIPHIYAIPVPTTEALRFVEARQALTNIPDPGLMNEVWEQYQDIWTDDLTEHGETVAALFNTP